jgi:hypothetical protein
MKAHLNIFVKTMSLICFGLLVACEPQDKALRATSGSGNRDFNENNKPAVNSREDSNRQMLLMLEKISESFHLLNAFTNPQYREGLVGAQLSVLQKENDSMIMRLEQKMSNAAFQVSAAQEFRVQIIAASAEKPLQIQLNNEGLELKSEYFKNLQSGKNVAIKNIQQKISVIETVPDLQEVAMTIRSIDEINLETGKTIAVSEIQLTARRIEEGTRYEIKSLTLKQNRVGSSQDQFELESSKGSLIFALESQCQKILGTLKLDSLEKKDNKPKYSRDIEMKEDQVTIGSGPRKTTLKLLECSQRPTVDLSKLL